MAKKRKTILLVSVALLVIIGVARELGFVKLSYYTLKYHDTVSRQTETARHSEPLTIPLSGVVVVSRVESSFADAVKGELEQQLGAKSSPYISVSLNQLEIEGAYWLPLFKRGHCVYQMQVRTARDNTVKDSWVSGETDFSVEGICSVRTLKQVIAKRIVQEAIKEIEG